MAATLLRRQDWAGLRPGRVLKVLLLLLLLRHQPCPLAETPAGGNPHWSVLWVEEFWVPSLMAAGYRGRVHSLRAAAGCGQRSSAGRDLRFAGVKQWGGSLWFG